MSNDGDGLMRRTTTGQEGSSSSKVESARRFLYDEDEPIGNQNIAPRTSNLGSSYNQRDQTDDVNGGVNTVFAKGGKFFLYSTAFVGIMVGLIWGIVALVGNNGTEHVNEERLKEFRTEILGLKISSESDLETVGSPQYHAIRWIADVDGAKLKAQDPYAMQRYALAVLFYSTSGTEDHVKPIGNWIDQSEWMTASGVCDWYGIDCEDKLEVEGSDKNQFVKNLSLMENGLVGTVPSELCALTRLTILDLSTNGIKGTLPGKIASLHELKNINMRENQLTGSIPNEFGVKLSNLRELDLGVNQLNGPIQIDGMVDLRSLRLEQNQFQGKVPNLKDLRKLNHLLLESNDLDGPFPSSLSNLTNLVEINLSKNHLTGSLPSDLESLTRLEKLILNELNLQGSIPSDIFMKVTRLTELALYNNNLTGQIPTTIAHLKDIQEFILGENKLSGTLPRQVGLMADLKKLELQGNNIRGSIPDIISALDDLVGLHLSRNSISGTIPPGIGSLHRLVQLHLESNNLGGKVPTEMGDLVALKEARLYENDLTGSIPAEFCALTSDEDLTYVGVDCATGNVACNCCTKCF